MGFIEIAYDDGNNVKITPSGNDILYGRKQAELCEIDRRTKSEPKRKTLHLEIPTFQTQSARQPSPITRTEDSTLFEALRKLRKQCADKEGFPPYIVFSDKVLHALATVKPTSVEAFGMIPGIGEHKKAKYGTLFVDLIVRHG